MPVIPPTTDQISEQASVMKVRYPKKTDPFSMKFRKGHRTYGMLKGKRPVTRAAKRPLR